MDDKCEILKREDSVPTEEEGCRVWPPPVSDLSQSEYSGTIESSLSLQLHQESSLINEDFVWHLATLQDGEEDPRSRGSARFDPQQGSSYGGDYQHPADRDASQAIQSGAFNLQQQRSPGSDSESDSSSDGFGLPVAAGSEDESDSESESDEDVPLAQRHPGALQAQRSLRDKARKDRKEKKAKARKAKEDAAARKPFQFESVMVCFVLNKFIQL